MAQKDIRYRIRRTGRPDFGIRRRLAATLQVLQPKIDKAPGPFRFGIQPADKPIAWTELPDAEALETRLRARLPGAPLGTTYHLDLGPATWQVRVAREPHKVPPVKFLEGLTPAQICRFPARKLNLKRAEINGGDAELQEAVLYAYRAVVDELEEKEKIVIRPISTYRDCKKQASVCASICGNPNGCPGRCACPGCSGHQRGICADSYLVKSGGHGYAGAYKKFAEYMKRAGFNNFTGFDPGGSDPWHVSFKITV